MQNAPHSKKQEYTGNLPFMLDKEQHGLSHHEIISQNTMLQHELQKLIQAAKKKTERVTLWLHSFCSGIFQ
jgi:hypothetical protein